MTFWSGLATATVVDLTVPFDPDLPCWWPELPAFTVVDSMTLTEHNIACRRLSLEEHNGTHMDAPRHIGDESHQPIDGRGSDQVPLASMWGRVRVVDATAVIGHELGRSPWVDASHILAYEQRTEPIRPGDAVLLYTGWSERYFLPLPAGTAYLADPLAARTPGWPAPTADFVDLLADRGVSVLGMDIPTMSALQDPFENHRAAFRRGVTPIENLTNLDMVEDLTSFFQFLPLLIPGGTGAPGRAIALLPNSSTHGATS